MSRFSARLRRADRRIDRAFADEEPALLIINGEQRPVTVIFEAPDASVSLPGGGDVRDTAPAISVYTTDIDGLEKQCEVILRGSSWWVTQIGADEEGRTRVRLSHGKPGRPVPEIERWS
ncbi:head-tail joining protein [Mixta calida]|uniref:head-tail joining protein n=1 Tax=Mixta calida TaxID=665913 RepID=UPI0034D4E761